VGFVDAPLRETISCNSDGTAHAGGDNRNCLAAEQAPRLFRHERLCLEDQSKAITFLTGECRFQLAQGFFPCQKAVMWLELKNGRTLVSFFMGDVAFGLSGGRDRQPNLENYYLSVDTVRVTRKGKPDETGEVEGECHFRLNRSASRFYFIRCDVYNRKVGFSWNFYLDSIESFDRKTFTSLQAQPNAPGVSSTQGSSQRPSSRVEVRLKKEGGTFVVPVKINGAITLDFTVDSGAADVSVPADVFSTLMRTGTIQDTDIIGEQTYVLADGSEAKSTTFTIRSLKVGDTVVDNVRGNIASVKGSLLLGQTFLERFKSWSVDNTRHVLLLEPLPDAIHDSGGGKSSPIPRKIHHLTTRIQLSPGRRSAKIA
jgi:clan AA aspartic protease (TIGR02281 family)